MSLRIATLALCGLLSSCALVPDSEPLRVFLLPDSPPPASQASAAPLDLALRISTPQASRVLASPRIAVVPSGNQIASYADARWADAAPTLLRDRIIEVFQQDGRLASVSSEDTHLGAQLGLISDLRAFQSQYQDGTPQVLIRLDARLVHSNSQRILASRRFEIRQPSADERLESVVVAFGQASDTLSRQLLEWTLAQGRAAPAQ